MDNTATIETNGHAHATDDTPNATEDRVELGRKLFGLEAADKIRIDAGLVDELVNEAARRFPGFPRTVALSVLIAEGAAIAGPKWVNDRKHLSDLAGGWKSGRSLVVQKALAGTSTLVSKVAAAQWPAANGVDGLCASLLLRVALTQSARKQPVLDKALADTYSVLTAKR